MTDYEDWKTMKISGRGSQAKRKWMEESMDIEGGGCPEWERGGNCEEQTQSGWKQWGAEGVKASVLPPCQWAHSGHSELLGNFDVGVGRLCWIKGFSLCWIVYPLKHAELCIFSPLLLTHSPLWTQTQDTSTHTYSIHKIRRRIDSFVSFFHLFSVRKHKQKHTHHTYCLCTWTQMRLFLVTQTLQHLCTDKISVQAMAQEKKRTAL